VRCGALARDMVATRAHHHRPAHALRPLRGPRAAVYDRSVRSIKVDPDAAASGASTAGEPVQDRSLPPPPRIGSYRVLGEIGRGGMARVYRVVDEGSGRELALKQLRVAKDERQRSSAALFEREFHTLVQLAHPRVIEVYDYGIANGNPYYTMELLDGGDLRARSPMPWREACELIFDVCSSLALLHSRRLVHRDITPRNVRCTHAGKAKLIDFGAMAPMGPGRQVVGTPAFVAPEVLHRADLDARTDLYSLGATLYYALTGRPAYSARHLAGMINAWRSPAPPPSLLVAGIPPELDRLVMSMLNLEPALRPRSAYEVMQRLSAIAGLTYEEPASVSQAYLASPEMVGRELPLSAFRRHMQRALRGQGGALLIEAGAGLGRSRLLDAFALEAKLLGAAAVRAGAGGEHGGRLTIAQALTEQLIDVRPDAALACARELDAFATLFELTAAHPEDDAASRKPRPMSLRTYPDTPAAQLAYQTLLAQWFLRVARKQALVIAVDDVDRLDDASVALLAGLAHRAPREWILLALTAQSRAKRDAAALDVLAQQCTKLPLSPLDRSETEQLLTSVFGDVPNVGLLAERVHAVAAGRPRECMAIAQHLVARGVISYARGNWTLPAELLADDLPSRAQDVYRARVAALDPRVRRLAQLQSLAAGDGFSRDDYALLDAGAAGPEIDAAITALLTNDIVRGDGTTYSLSAGAVRDALLEGIGPAERAELHRALAEHAERTARHAMHVVLHLFAAGLEQRALDRLLTALQAVPAPEDLERESRMSATELASLLERGLDASERLARSALERCELMRWLFLYSVTTEDRFYRRTAAGLLAQLERDSGLASYRARTDVADPMQRLMQALQHAGERYAAAPEHERVYRVDDAIKHLVYYVVISIAVGARTFDGPLLASLPALLEPFAPLSPVLSAMWQNALATYDVGAGRAEHAYERWSELYAKLEHVDAAALAGVDRIRNAIAYGLGAIDAQLGRDAMAHWAAILDKDPLQRVNAMYLRKTLCLHRGDFQSAERFRRKAEVLAVQSTVRQMFSNTLTVELTVAALTRDLTGVKQIADRIAPLAAQYPGWRPYGHLAQVHFYRLRGDLELARQECERALELVAPGGRVAAESVLGWWPIATSYIEVLVELECCEQARAFGLQALQACRELGVGRLSDDIERALALAEAKLGDLAGAAARIDAILGKQPVQGMHGLIVGATYEARARIAIWAGDRAAVEHFGQLAAREYRFGRESPLGARYEQLVHEARVAGIHALPQLDSFTSTHVGTTSLGGARATVESSVTAAFKSAAEHPAARAEVALGLLCEAHASRGGHLYVLGERGLALACSLSAAPDPQLEPLLHAFWQDNLLEPDLPTECIPEGSPEATPAAKQWTDSRGTAYQPLLISCVADGIALHVGVALLIPGGSAHRSAGATQVVTTVASYLLAAGDARSARA
jgi:hypothetical protein